MEKTSYPSEIQKFFNEIIVKVKNSLNPDFIIMAGSFGKESWLYSDDKLISDFEFVFVCKRKWSLSTKKKLQKDLNQLYPFDISLKGFLLDKVKNKVLSNYASKNPGYLSLDFYDTFSNPVVLYSKTNASLNINCNVNEIPIWEAWRLYVNRIGDLLKLESSDNIDNSEFDYFWLKVFESTAGSYCIIKQIYDKNISNRLTMFTQDLVNNDNELNQTCKDSFPIINQALIARKEHDLSLFKNNLSVNQSKKIVISWLEYFEKKLLEDQQLPIDGDKTFYNKYLSSKSIQNNYLGFNYYCNKLVSNSIRLVYNPQLIGFNFKFYNNLFSWRHLILATISSTYKEHYLGDLNFPKSKEIASKMIAKKFINNLEDKKFINETLNYWKILR